MESIDALILEFENALLEINRVKTAEIFEKCYEKEQHFDLLENLTINTLERIGEGWENGTISLAQVYMSGVICEELIDKYLPKLNVKRKKVPKIAIGVLQDHHALGKRIVYSILRAGGYEILDLGQGLSIDELVQKAIDKEIEILLISTLMLPSALKISAVKEKLLIAGVHTKIIVGGAPFRLDNDLWKSVKADAYCNSASDVIGTIERLISHD